MIHRFVNVDAQGENLGPLNDVDSQNEKHIKRHDQGMGCYIYVIFSFLVKKKNVATRFKKSFPDYTQSRSDYFSTHSTKTDENCRYPSTTIMKPPDSHRTPPNVSGPVSSTDHTSHYAGLCTHH